MIAVIDYGLGNLKSVHKAFKLLGYESKITTNRKQILDSQAIVFPGVGSFGDCMNELDGRNLISPIYDSIKSGKFFLGICLGLQILFNESEESPGVKGLNIIDGAISKIKFSDDLKVPHMGWNKINIQKKSNVFELYFSLFAYRPCHLLTYFSTFQPFFFDLILIAESMDFLQWQARLFQVDLFHL